MKSFWVTFRFLMWKNYLLQVRKPWSTFFEIVMPLTFFILLVAMRSVEDPEIIENVTRFSPIRPDDFSIFNDYVEVNKTEAPTASPLKIDFIEVTDSNETMLPIASMLKSSDIFEYAKKYDRSPTSKNLTDYFTVIPEIFYSPQNEYLSHIMSHVEDEISLFASITAVNDSMSLEKKMRSNNYLVGIEFPDEYRNLKSLPTTLKYKVRFPGELRSTKSLNIIWFNWMIDHLFVPFPLTKTRNADDHDGAAAGYYKEGFLIVQSLMFEAFMKAKNESVMEKIPKIYVQKFPYPPGIFDVFIQPIQLMIPMYMSIGFLFPCINIVKYILVEKEEKHKKLMKIMGVKSHLHWIAWFVKCFIYMMLISIMILIILKVNWFNLPRTIFTFSSFSVLFVFFMIYCITSILFAFMMTTFFKKSSIAAAVTALIWILQMIPYLSVTEIFMYAKVSHFKKIIIMFFHNSGMGLGFRIIATMETKDGVRWNNLFENYHDDINLGTVMIILAVDGLLYLMVIFVVKFLRKKMNKKNVKEVEFDDYELNQNEEKLEEPGENISSLQNSLQKSLNSIQSSDNLSNEVERLDISPQNSPSSPQRHENLSNDLERLDDSLQNSPQSPETIENLNNLQQESGGSQSSPKPVHKPHKAHITFDAFLKIRNLTKIYPNSSKPAVNTLNLSLYKDQITVLLGINGAGKSTTMSMLCGEIKPTSGTVFVDSIDLLEDGKIQYDSTGVSFQENVLFNNLTVHEHLIFYGRLKGSSEIAAELEAQQFMKILKLRPDDYACNLSGGMKRKLCMAIALCDHSKLVILDEISSGVDPASRREMWNFLQSIKKDRAILMSTHFMLEAEVVADKIAILCEGKLKAFGTPFELKQKYSKTCNLICVKKPLCDSQRVVDFVRQFIPKVRVANEIGMEICFKFESGEVPNIHEVLKNLEENMQELHLENFGISSSSLDEVFERVDENIRLPFLPCFIENCDYIMNMNKKASSYNITETFHDNLTLFFKQLSALLVKKWIVIKRNHKLHLLQVLLPMLMVVFSTIFVNSSKFSDHQNELDLSIRTYLPSRIFMKLGDDVDENSLQFKIYKTYKTMLTNVNDIKLIETANDMEETFLENSKKVIDLNYRNLFGLSVNAENITGWFNNQPYHTIPITLNLMHNAILKAIFGDTYGISVGNKPLPFKIEAKAASLPYAQSIDIYLVSLNIGYALAISYAIFVISIIRERVGKVKYMQMMIGIRSYTYWLSMFIMDFLIVLIISICVSTTYEIFQNPNYQSTQEFWRVLILMITFGSAILPVTYTASFFFKSASSGFIKLILLFITLGVGLFVLKMIFILWVMDHPNFDKAYTTFSLPMPHYNFCDAMKRLFEMNAIVKVCDLQCEYGDVCDRQEQCRNMDICCDTEYFSWTYKGINWSIARFIIILVVSLHALILVESKGIWTYFKRFKSLVAKFPTKFLRRSIRRKCSIELNIDSFTLDPDVEIEKRKVENLSDENLKHFNLVLRNLTKVYKTNQAVKQLSVAINPGECFGLLGVNGAGKTTTFRMLIGDLQPTSGEIFIKGLNLKTHIKEIHKIIGYCGQFDTFVEELTGRETLTFYAKCRGIKEDKIQSTVVQLANDFDFARNLDKQVRQFSGGNKRKLSSAVALIGDPQIIYLDEPTSFMDPLVKRKFWQQIAKLRDSGKTIILSSHSMDEVEVLCTRIGIMMNGEMKCLGSPQYLKSKFGRTIVVTLKLKKSEVTDAMKNEVKRYIDRELVGAILKEEFTDMLIYHLTSQSYKWSQIFKVIETAKEVLNVIDDFTVNQSNLVQVFLQVTKNGD